MRSLLDTIQNTFFCDSLDFNKGSWNQIINLTPDTTSPSFDSSANFVNNATDDIVLAGVNGSLWISYDIGQNFTMILNNQGIKKAFISNKIIFNDCRSQSCSECGDSNGGWETTDGIFTWVPSSATTQSVCIPACGGGAGTPQYPAYYDGMPSMQNFYESKACNTCDSHFVGYVNPDNATGPGTKLNSVYSSGDIGKYYLTLTSGVYGGVSYNTGVYLMVDSDDETDTVGIVELPIYDPGDPSLTDSATNMCRLPCGEGCRWIVQTGSYNGDFCTFEWSGSSWTLTSSPGLMDGNMTCNPPNYTPPTSSPGEEATIFEYGQVFYWTIKNNPDLDCCDCVAPTIPPTTIGQEVSTPATKLPRLTGF